jgi:hypothetical protein
MELEDKMLASADDMTAAEIAPNPKKDTHWIESWEYTFTHAILKIILFIGFYWLSLAKDL